MSNISLIKGSFQKLQDNLPTILMGYMDDLDEAPGRLSIKGKNLEEALKEQGAWPILYANIKSELGILCKYMETEIDSIRSKSFIKYTEKHSRDLSDRAKDKYIDSEPEYLSYNELFLEVKELHEKSCAVVDAFTTRGFALRDITQIRINQLHTTVL